jgi:hypothetical protein
MFQEQPNETAATAQVGGIALGIGLSLAIAGMYVRGRMLPGRETMVEQQIASGHLIPGDTIRPSKALDGSVGEVFAKVTEVKLLGVFVKIDTDIGVSELLPVNRSITVWRRSEN